MSLTDTHHYEPYDDTMSYLRCQSFLIPSRSIDCNLYDRSMKCTLEVGEESSVLRYDPIYVGYVVYDA